MYGAPPLGELYDLLRADGFVIGVDDHAAWKGAVVSGADPGAELVPLQILRVDAHTSVAKVNGKVALPKDPAAKLSGTTPPTPRPRSLLAPSQHGIIDI